MQIEYIVDHPSGIEVDFTVSIWKICGFAEIANKLSQAKSGLAIALTGSDAPHGLLIELLHAPLKSLSWNDLRRDAIAHILQGHGLPLGTLLICVDGSVRYLHLHFVALERDVLDGVQNFNSAYLPIELVWF